MTESSWTLTAADGELQVLTGVGGPAAKMGHRLTIAMASWQAGVTWRGTKPVAADLVVEAAHADPPTLPEVTGGPGSVIGWTSQSRESRRWLSMVLRAALSPAM